MLTDKKLANKVTRLRVKLDKYFCENKSRARIFAFKYVNPKLKCHFSPK